MSRRNGSEILTGNSKRKKIRDNAKSVFLRYGFQRTSMDDIAKAAGMSRPALYLIYKNKEDIYCDILQALATEGIWAAEQAAKSDGSLQLRLTRMVNVGFLETFEQVAQSTHGPELMDIKFTLGRTIRTDWRNGIVALMAKVIGGNNGKVHANLIFDVIDGLKARTLDIEEIRSGIKTVVDLIAR